jgi:predicted lipoprotein with Yx(FWY)xxD motif
VPGDAGADPSVTAQTTTLERADGSSQLVAGEWPLYTFSGDSAPGDVNGQGSGGKWFAVAPDGGLYR